MSPGATVESAPLTSPEITTPVTTSVTATSVTTAVTTAVAGSTGDLLIGTVDRVLGGKQLQHVIMLTVILVHDDRRGRCQGYQRKQHLPGRKAGENLKDSSLTDPETDDRKTRRTKVEDRKKYPDPQSLIFDRPEGLFGSPTRFCVLAQAFTSPIQSFAPANLTLLLTILFMLATGASVVLLAERVSFATDTSSTISRLNIPWGLSLSMM